MRIDIGVRALDPSLEIIAPARGADWPSREELLDYVAAHDIPVNLTKKSPYSIDENLWGRSNECGVLEDPWVAPPEDAFQFVKCGRRRARRAAARRGRSFEKGKPVALDGVAMGMVELIETIDAIGNAHGFGRVDMIENRLVGIKSREVYEVAGSLALITAHRELEDLVLTRDLLHFKRTIESQARRHDLRGPVVRSAHRGLQGVPVPEPGAGHRRRAPQVPQGQLRGRRAAGATSRCTATSSPPTRTEDEFSHTAAAGFIELWGLPIEVWARVGKEHHLMQELEIDDGARDAGDVPARPRRGAGGRR